MNEGHQRFHDWLTGGADGDPPRDAAVHASVCTGCRRSIDALDRLAAVNTGLAPMPVAPTGRERGPLAMAGRLIGATAVLFSAAILGVGVSQLIGVQPSGEPVAQANRTPEQSVLAETATPQPTAPPTPSATPEETLTPLGTPVPTHAPVVTPKPWRPPPTPIPTAPPTAPPPPPTPTSAPTATPVPPSPTPVPTATPIPPTDTDGDGVTDADEVTYGSDPTNILSTPENGTYASSTCTDGVDNDLDLATDTADSGCL